MNPFVTEYVDLMCENILDQPHLDAWNGTGPLQTEAELDRHSFVKCAINQDSKIMYCFAVPPPLPFRTAN